MFVRVLIDVSYEYNINKSVGDKYIPVKAWLAAWLSG